MRNPLLVPLLTASLLFVPACAAKQLRTDLATKQTELEDCHTALAAETAKLEVQRSKTKSERTAKQLAEARLEAYRDLAKQLRAAFGDEGLDIIVRNGRLVVQLPNAVLFESGKRELKPEGKIALAKLAGVLKGVPDRRFLVAGHTDNVPVKASSAFKSNWELSTLRATTAVEFIITKGVKPNQLGAAGYGEFMPEVKNDTDANRAKNRRLEIIVMPNASEIPPMPNDL